MKKRLKKEGQECFWEKVKSWNFEKWKALPYSWKKQAIFHLNDLGARGYLEVESLQKKKLERQEKTAVTGRFRQKVEPSYDIEQVATEVATFKPL